MSTLRTAELVADPRVRRGMTAQLAARRRRLSAGERSLGWKLGFGSAPAMEKLDTMAPLVGFLTDRSPLEPVALHSVDGWVCPVLEPEIAVRVGADVSARDGADAEAAIVAIAPAFELADLDREPEDVAEILAGNIFHRHVFLGPWAATAPPRISSLRASVVVGGERRTIADPQGATGDLVALVTHVGRLLAAFGESLRAGELLFCGSIVAPIAVAAGDSVGYELEPVGEISVQFE